MPLLREQRLLLCGLFIVGLNPLVITKSGRSLRFCRSRRLYTYFVNLMLTPLIVVNMIDKLYEIFGADGRPQTRVVVQVCQGILLMIAYFVVLIYGLWSPRRKLAWINMLLRNCCTVEVISIRAIFQRTHYEAIGLNVLHLTLVVVLECMLREDLLPALMLFLIVLTVNMEVLHLRSMAEVLACRMSRVRQGFAVAIRQQRNQNVYGVMDHLDRFERLWILKNHLEQICGAFLGVHFVLDLIMVTFLLFIIGYFCSHVGGKRVFIICTVAFFTRIVPVGVKMVLLVRPFVRVAIEVSTIIGLLDIIRNCEASPSHLTVLRFVLS